FTGSSSRNATATGAAVSLAMLLIFPFYERHRPCEVAELARVIVYAFQTNGRDLKRTLTFKLELVFDRYFRASQFSESRLRFPQRRLGLQMGAHCSGALRIAGSGLGQGLCTG